MRRKKSKLSKAELLNRQIASWEGKQEGAVIMLRKSAEMLVKLRRQRKRVLDRETAAFYADVRKAEHPTVDAPAPEPYDVNKPTEITRSEMVGDDIPTFLDRAGKEKDAAARAEIEAEQATKKKQAAERRIKKLKIGQETKRAELTGQRRKMPLTGKDALAAIRAD